MRKYQLVVIVCLSGRRYLCSRKFCKGNKYEIKDNSSDNHCLDCRRYVGTASLGRSIRSGGYICKAGKQVDQGIFPSDSRRLRGGRGNI